MRTYLLVGAVLALLVAALTWVYDSSSTTPAFTPSTSTQGGGNAPAPNVLRDLKIN